MNALRAGWGLTLIALAGCSGPDAPDPAVCQDTLHRLCAEPRCAQVTSTLAVGTDCEAVLLGRTGCADDAFSFEHTVVSRASFLSCRAPLLRSGGGAQAHPDCKDVAEVLDTCDLDLVPFLQGVTP